MKKIKILGMIATLAMTAMVLGCADNTLADIKRYNAMVGNYEKGAFDYTNGSYTSEYWDLDLDFDDNWIAEPEEDMTALVQSMHDSIVQNATTSLAEEGLSQEVIDEYEKSVSVNGEALLSYVSGGEKVGTVHMCSMSLYSPEDEKNIDSLIEGMVGVLESTQSGQKTVGGFTYEYLNGTMTEGLLTLDVSVLVREKNGMYLICIIMGFHGSEIEQAFVSLID